MACGPSPWCTSTSTYAIRRAPLPTIQAMATAGSSYTQNPEARSGMAWWRPPAGLKAWSARPERTASAATSDPPATRAEASCISGKIGLSPGPNPNGHQSPGSPAPARFTAST
jgi:hypothetical protein